MVRHLLQGRIDRILRTVLGPLWGPLSALKRLITLVLRWLATWLAHLARTSSLKIQVGLRVAGLLVHPADPNNLFTVSSSSYHMAEAGRSLADLPQSGERRGSALLFTATDLATGAEQEEGNGPPEAVAISLKGVAEPNTDRVAAGTARVNHRFSYLDLLQTELKRVQANQIHDLHVVINRLARRWLDLDQEFQPVERRIRLDIPRTLRYNIPRYGGYVLDFKWATRNLPVPRFNKPARILAIGDVSHSMYLYATVSLYFLHMLNFVFQVDSYVFSERATRSTPYLNGPGSFEEKMRDLIQNASSWNAGTRLGSSLQQIVAQAQIDQYTYVLIATDGKVALSHGEYELIHQHMDWIKRHARTVIFLTPEAPFAQSHGQRAPVEQVGLFQSGIVTLPIFNLDQIWYNTLGKYADRVYLVRTVQDLVDACTDLYYASRD